MYYQQKSLKKGNIKGSINIETDKLSAKEIVSKLPKNKTIIFNCSAGARSIEAWMKLKKMVLMLARFSILMQI